MKASNGRSRRVAAVSAGVLLLAGALGYRWLRRPPPDPRDVVRRLWAGQGVAKPNVMLVTLDTTTIIRAEDFYILDDHMTARGHERLGEALGELLTRLVR